MDLTRAAEWLDIEAKRLLEGCRRVAHDGITQCYTPDGEGRYPAMWTRDFYYMVAGYDDAFSPLDLHNALAYLLAGISDGATAPDRVQMDGRAVYSAGGVDNPLGEPPTDNAAFLILALAHAAESHTLVRLVVDHADTLERMMEAVPRRDGLVFIDPAGPPRSPYGFTDTIAKTGGLLFSSLLYWEACQALAELLQRHRMDFAAAERWHKVAADVKDALVDLWDESEGMFLAATHDCRQVDVWGSAYAAHIGAAGEDQEQDIATWLAEHHGEVVWHGMVRHVRERDGWQRQLRPSATGRYQNGGYWPLATPWVVDSLFTVDRDLARRTMLDLIEHFQAHGVCEWASPDGGVGAMDYVASATVQRPVLWSLAREEEG